MVTTPHYSYILPVVGGSLGSWGNLLNAIFPMIDSNIFSAAGGMTIGVNVISSGVSVTLTNPMNNIQSATFSATGKALILPPMNVTASPVAGGIIYVTNTGTNAFEIFAQDGTTSVVTSLAAGASVSIEVLTNATANGTFQVVGPFVSSGSNLIINGSSSGSTTVQASAVASGVLTLPAATDTLLGAATTNTLTNKTFDTAGTGNVFKVNGNGVTSYTGTGGTVALSVAPAFTGIPTAPTASVATSTTQLATTAFVNANAVAVMTGGTLGAGNVVQNSTFYMWLGAGTGESNFYVRLPPGTIQNLRVKASAGLPSGQTTVFTLRQNGSSTSITCTITGTSDTAADLTHQVTVSENDVFDIKIVTGATTGTLDYTFSIEMIGISA